ncbi:hypothetical protein BLD48_09710 [Exiguobacterium sp. KRL4]|nr:hypothetical protein BLD48_09710 [Exiguobacterium sp. KRL4]
MTLSAVLFDLDGTLLDRTTSLQLFLKSQHARLIAPVSTCPLDAYQTLFLTFDQNGLVWKDVVYQKLITHFQLEGVTATELLQDTALSVCLKQCLVPSNARTFATSITHVSPWTHNERSE